ncbi:MAG: hypothetical protein PWP23_2803 [Candidatus Sumerlaeota bacterium]|nr:hypothetical protein [Candidatus Sumerlaeota bacterium]
MLVRGQDDGFHHQDKPLRDVPRWRDWASRVLLVLGGAFIGAAIPMAILIMTPAGVVASSTTRGSAMGLALVGIGALIGASWVIEGLMEAAAGQRSQRRR